jgi:hypothetical protein
VQVQQRKDREHLGPDGATKDTDRTFDTDRTLMSFNCGAVELFAAY